MKVVLVTGQRGWDDEVLIDHTLKFLNPDVVIDGMAPGADTLAYEWVERNNRISRRFAADWEKWGALGGPIRNAHMIHALVEYQTQDHKCIVVAFLDETRYGESRGTRNCIQQAMREGFKVIDAKKWTPKQRRKTQAAIL